MGMRTRQVEPEKKKEEAESKKKSDEWSALPGFPGIPRWVIGLRDRRHAPEPGYPLKSTPEVPKGSTSAPSSLSKKEWSLMDKVLKSKSTQKGSNFGLPGVVFKDKSFSPPTPPPERLTDSSSVFPSGVVPSVGRASRLPVSVGRLPSLDEEIKHLENRLRPTEKRIQYLEVQKAKYGINFPSDRELELDGLCADRKNFKLNIKALKKEQELQKQYDAEVLTAAAISVNSAIAQKSRPTSARTLAMREEIMNPLFDHHSLLLGSSGVNLAYQFQVRADLESKRSGQPVSAKELIRREIEKLEDLSISCSTETEQKTELLQWRLHLLRQAEGELKAEQQPPEDIWSPIPPDAVAKALPQFPGIDDRGVCFQLDEKRRLRITVHKPSTEEQKGSFSIYESYSETDTKVRIAYNYYRVWDSNKLNFPENTGLLRVLDKISDACSSEKLCDHEIAGYRLPYCFMFLGVIDEHVLSDPRMSNGLHIPICIARQSTVTEENQRMLRAEDVQDRRSIPHWMFTELFNRGMLGSDWLERERLLDLHKFLASLLPAGTFVILSQEYSYPQEDDTNEAGD